MVAWLVAALVMVINGYLLLDFFSNEVNGILFGFIVCSFTAGYAAFIVYLVFRGITIPRWCKSKSCTDTVN
jgi:natural resistance-associated macrophage protein